VSWTKPQQFVILSALRERLATNLEKEQNDEYITIHRLAASYFHQPLDRLDLITVDDVIEELGYLAVADPDQAAERLADFGLMALMVGWLEAASRAVQAVRLATSKEPAYGRVSPIAHLVTTLAAIFSEPKISASSAAQLQVAVSAISESRNDAEQVLIEMAQRAITSLRPGQIQNADQLTAREMAVVRLVAEGLSNREIAAQLYISSSTVKTHLARVFQKLHVSTRHELTLEVDPTALIIRTQAAQDRSV
jgi:DNA-binding NarL/FixJ family response regulator